MDHMKAVELFGWLDVYERYMKRFTTKVKLLSV